MISGIDPKVDFAFKRLFGREENLPLLVHLLNAVLQLPAEEEIVELKLINPFNDKEDEDDKLSIVDVRVCDLHGRQLDIETQLRTVPAFTGRLLYYWSCLHKDQLKKGDLYTKLCPTISVCFTDFTMFADVYDYRLVFELLNKLHGKVLSRDIQFITLELPKFQLNADNIFTPLQRWMYFLRHGDTLDSENLPAKLDVPEIRQAMEVLTVISKDDIERERYEARMRVLRDEQTRLFGAREEGRQEGREEGRQEGRQEGHEKGRQEGRLEIVQLLLEQRFAPLSDKVRKKLSTLSDEQLNTLCGEVLKAESLGALGLDD